MNPFAGKSPTERNKMIAASILGVVALLALYLAFGRGMFSSTKTIAVTASPTPRVAGSPGANIEPVKMPAKEQQEDTYTSVPIVYNPNIYAPEPARNIFAFYEPGKPCPECPTPLPKPTEIKTPTPTPTPPMRITFVTPQTVYAGSGSFRLEANGDKLDPTARIYFNQSELPTQFISPQRLVANVPAAMIASAGSGTVIAQTPDGKLYSDQVIISIQAPPKPQFQYVGMIARKRYNNDTAYLMETGRQVPTGYRLNDVVGGRFRLISISSNETVFEDVNLGFKHRVQLYRPAPGTTGSTSAPTRPGFPTDGSYVPYNPNPNINNPNLQQDIPGIPSNIPRYVPPQNVQPQRPPDKKDQDDKDDDGDN